jgi:hypothetical protein
MLLPLDLFWCYGQPAAGSSFLIVAVALSDVLDASELPPKYPAIPPTNEYVCGYVTVTAVRPTH